MALRQDALRAFGCDAARHMRCNIYRAYLCDYLPFSLHLRLGPTVIAYPHPLPATTLHHLTPPPPPRRRLAACLRRWFDALPRDLVLPVRRSRRGSLCVRWRFFSIQHGSYSGAGEERGCVVGCSSFKTYALRISAALSVLRLCSIFA